VTVLNSHHAAPQRPLLQRPRVWLLGWLLGFQALGYCAVAVQAPPECDAAPAGQTLDEALAALRSLEPKCHKHAPYLYTLGQLLNQAGQYEDAIDPLEGAILYRPDHWPSQLEYAIALEGTGDHVSAMALIQGLQQNPGVDAAVRQQLAALQRQPAHAASTAERRGTINLVAGFDNNLLSSTYHTQFTLTTPDGNLPVELADDQQPRAGEFARAEVTYDGLLTQGASAQWRYSLVGSYRVNPALSATNMAQLGVQLERTATGSQGVYAMAQHQTLLRTDAVTLRQTQLGLGYDLPMGGDCAQRVGVDLQQLAYPASSALDGRYTGAISNTLCQSVGLQLLVRTGQDRPLGDDRPGGVQQQTSVRLTKRTPLGPASLTLELEASHQQDQQGYSLLLANNAQRTISRYAYRIEYRWQLGALSPYIGAEWLDQRSNLELFELKNWVATAGVRSRW
jgi:tetratricopeptide (TPR) repeat protein